MKRFLMATIAVFMMVGSAMAAENVIEVNVVMTQKENALDKLIALVNGFTKKVNAVKTIGDLMAVAEKFYTEMMTFEEKYADEIARLEETLTEAQIARYETRLEQALEAFEAAVEKKTEQLMESYDVDDF